MDESDLLDCRVEMAPLGRRALRVYIALLALSWAARASGEGRSPSRELEQLLQSEYSYRDIHRADWTALFSKYASSLEGAGSSSRFATVAAELLSAAHDVHIAVVDGQRILTTFHRTAVENYSLGLIAARVPDVRSDHHCVSWGRTSEGDGYVLIGDWTPACARSALGALDELRGITSLIVDVRPNSGGSDDASAQVAGRFATKPVVYEAVERRSHGITSAREPRVLVPSTGQHFAGRVVVLMGPRCMSSNEAFLLMMRSAGAVLIGDRSFGSSGNPQPHRLSNGVVVSLPSWIAYQPNGSLLEQHGIEPDVRVGWPPGTTNDVVLAAAIRFLHPAAK